MTSTTLQRGFAPEVDRPSIQTVPFISVIVPVRNEAAFIGKTLRQLLDQNYDSDRFEILVADGQSTDGTREIVRELQASYAHLHLLDNPKRWSSSGRNLAIRAAQGDIIVIVDGHCEFDDANYLANLANAFEQSGADCVGRPQPLDISKASTLQRAIALARSSRLGHHPDSFIYSDVEQIVPPQSVAVAYRRSVFAAVGLFDETFDACEDVEFNHRVARAGLRCLLSPRIRLHYVPRSGLGSLFRQMARYGRGRVRLLRKHPETFSLAGFLPAAFLLGMVIGPAISWLSPWLVFAYAGCLGAYVLTVLLFSLSLAIRGRDWRLLPVLPLVFAAVHMGAGTGILQELMIGPWRRRSLVEEKTLESDNRQAA
jgi:succinoglycan biosynthesis protein ExoA